MKSIKGLIAGIVSGLSIYSASVQTIGITSAVAMPRGWQLALWDMAVVFGMGAGFTALVIHAVIVSLVRDKVSISAALVGALLALVAIPLVVEPNLPPYKAWAAWLLGIAIASFIARNQSKKAASAVVQ
jgi:hypothetical protein